MLQESVHFHEGFLPPPPTGYQLELARICHVDKRTVRNALRRGVVSPESLRVRREYMKRYVQPHLRKAGEEE